MQPSPPDPVRLYCIPYAGATSSIYRSWQGSGAPDLHIIGVDPPGRGTRAREPRAADYRALVRSIAEFMAADFLRAREHAPGLRYATFGHSFGAMVSLAAAAAMARACGQEPERAFLSAALPPRLQPSSDEEAPSTDEELLEKIIRDGGTSPALLNSEAMAKYLIRLMREDYAIRRQFAQDSSLRVGFPLTLFAAQEDYYLSPGQMWQWSEHSSAPCRQIEIPGDHFAAFRQSADTLAVIRDDLSAEYLIARP